MKAMERINKLFVKLILIFSICVSFYLFVQSIFTGVRIDQSEKPYFVSNGSILGLIVWIVLFITFGILYKKVNISDDKQQLLIKIYLVVCFLFVLSSVIRPHVDMLHVMECAAQIRVGDFSSLEKGGYLNLYPVQNGIVLFLLLLSYLVGDMNYIAVQLLNVCSVGCVLFCFYKFWKKYKSNYSFEWILLAIILFIPIVLYMNLVYGTVIGLSCSILAIIEQQKYIYDNKSIDAVASILFICVACILKSNYSVFLIGIVIIYILNVKLANLKKDIVLISLLLLSFVGTNRIVNIVFPVMAGNMEYKSEGCSMWAWLSVGLSESTLGWYDAFTNTIWEESGYNREKTAELSKDRIIERLTTMREKPNETAEFFHKKITSMWCEPAYQSFYLNKIGNDGLVEKHSVLRDDLVAYTGRINRVVYVFLDGFQLFIYFGVFLYALFLFNRVTYQEVVGLLIFIGGFVFHIFWEVKAMYAYMYFVLLIPYAIIGYISFYNKEIIGINCFKKDKWSDYKKAIYYLVFALFSLALAWGLKVDEDNARWDTWLKEHRYVPDGVYSLYNVKYKDDMDGKYYLELDTSDRWYYELKSIDGRSLLSISDNNIINRSYDEASELELFNGRWQIEREGGAYLFRQWTELNKALTYNEDGTISVEDYKNGEESQLWELKK